MKRLAPIPLALLLALPAAAQQEGQSREAAAAAAMRRDARLAKKITLTHRDAPLGDLLPPLGRSLGVRLTTGPDTGDDKVTLFLKERPAFEALALLARHLDFQWYRSGTGYELTQSGPAQAREASLRESARAAQTAAAHARMEAVARALELPRERAQERLKEIDALLREPAITADERAALVSEQAALHDAQRPGAVPAVGAYRSLSAVQAHQLRTTGEVRLSSADGSLPPPLAEQIHAAFAQMRSSGEVLAIRVGPGGPPAGADEDLPPVQADAIIRLSDSGPALRMAPVDIPRPGGAGGRFLGLPASSRRRLRLDFTLNSVRGRDGDRRVLPVIWMPTDPQQEGQRPATRTEDAELKKEVDLAIPVPPPPAAAPGAPAGLRITILGQGNARPGMIPLSRVAEALHHATGLEVLCDSFVRARVEPARVKGRRSVAQVLDAIAQDLDYRWEKEGGAIRLRSGLYYEDRPAEVPERILRPWRARVAQKGVPHLDDLAELAAALDDARLRGMQDFWGWYLEGTGIEAPRGAAGLYGMRHHLRYWASLSRPQRQAVLAGNALPVAQMTGQQRQAFLAALASPAESPFLQNTLARAPNAAEVAAGAFSLRQQESKQQAYTSDGADGQRSVAIIAGGPGGPNPPPPPRLPDGRELQPAGPPTILDGYMFMYFLAGEERPARTMLLNVPRPNRS